MRAPRSRWARPPDRGPRRPRARGAEKRTRRGHEVARLVAERLTSRQIAARLVLSPRIVEGHLERITAKLGFGTRARIAAWAVATEPHETRTG